MSTKERLARLMVQFVASILFGYVLTTSDHVWRVVLILGFVSVELWFVWDLFRRENGKRGELLTLTEAIKLLQSDTQAALAKLVALQPLTTTSDLCVFVFKKRYHSCILPEKSPYLKIQYVNQASPESLRISLENGEPILTIFKNYETRAPVRTPRLSSSKARWRGPN